MAFPLPPTELQFQRYGLDFDGRTVDLWCPQPLGYPPGGSMGGGGIDQCEFENFTAFQKWKTKIMENLKRQTDDENHVFHHNPYVLRSIHINAVTRFPNGQVGFVKMEAWIEREDGDQTGQYQQNCGTTASNDNSNNNNRLYETVFLRGSSVAVLMILRPTDSRDERVVILTEQPRVPACSLSFLELPAGMLDRSGDFASDVALAIQGETGIRVLAKDLTNMTELALQGEGAAGEAGGQETLEPAMYPSPGSCDEYVSIFLWENDVERVHIEALKHKLAGARPRTGKRDMITIRLVDYENLWRCGARDAKILGACALYEGLTRSGQLPRDQDKLKDKRSSVGAVLQAMGRAKTAYKG